MDNKEALKRIEELVRKVYYENTPNKVGVTSYVNKEEGIEAYKIETGTGSFITGRGGVEAFDKAFREAAKKYDIGNNKDN